MVECPICMCILHSRNKFFLACKHILCKKCEKIWFHNLKKERCPICNKKREIDLEEDEIIIKDNYYSRFSKHKI